MTRYDELEQQRLDKVERLRAQGVDPYPVRFDRTATAAELQAEFADLDAGAETGRDVAVAGRLMLKRGQGKLAFGTLRDASGELQLFCSLDKLGQEKLDAFYDLDLGDWIGAHGEVIKTKRGEVSVRVDTITLLAKDIRPLPDKWHGGTDSKTSSSATACATSTC
jgi:lysyl-tRNA synthetase, class II